MGLTALIYRPVAYMQDGIDCSNNGWSNRFEHVCVVNASGPFEPSETVPAVMVVRHRTMNTLHAIAVEHYKAGVWTMAGGNFLHCTDSRFSELCVRLMEEGGVKSPRYFSVGAISIHDRIE